MRLIRYTVFTCVLATSPTIARAHSSSCNLASERDVDDCLSKALSGAQATLKRYETVAEDVLRKSSDRSTSVKDFTGASAYWTKYRDGECAAVFDQYADGTARVPLYDACAISLTKARTHEVWDEFLKPIGGGSPLLPEP